MKKKQMALETRAPIDQPKVFPPRRQYSSLSIKDLLDALEAYHVYLSTLEVVVATAIGRYLIHKDDWYFKNPPGVKRPSNFPRVKEPVTLENSDSRPWSWPAVLIFVKQWHANKHFGSGGVPRTLYLPDGRVVPTCVIYAPPDESSSPPAFSPSPSSELLGGGYLCLRRHQGEQALGTLGCIVRKGGTYYALTNRHVAGVDGEVLFAKIRGEYEPVGKTSALGVDRQLLPSVFSAWPGPRSFLNLDAGLVRIEDINDWTSQVFGIGEIGDVFDATEQTITLDLIGCEVRAFGGVSGVVEGVIRALFFRYESLGGSEYVTDVLIGPRNSRADVPAPITRPGDSGTIWFYDPPRKRATNDGEEDNFAVQEPTAEHGVRARRLRPIAMQWGGQRIVSPNGKVSAYALGSFLSTICRSLDVQVVRNWSLGHDEYWGKIGHFAIGWKACDRLSGNLGHLMKQNQPRIGFGNETLGQGAAFRVGREGFVPLADVPDYVWIPQKGSRGGEGIQHFADIDIVDIDGNPALLKRCVAEPKNVSATIWKEYFDGFADKEVGPDEGTLPFRVWQIWDAMVNYLKKKDLLRFVAAAGILSHYVGDASQPLHCSYLHHGKPPMITVGKRKYPVPRGSEKYKEWKKSREAKIHGIYEQGMLEVNPLAALDGVDNYLRSRRNNRQFDIGNGHEAAAATINLMNSAQSRLPPEYLIRQDDPELGPKERAKLLWENSKIQDGTIACLADSVLLLAALWETAWGAGDGKQIPKAKLVQFEEDHLEEVYRNRNFLPGLTLNEMVKTKQFEP